MSALLACLRNTLHELCHGITRTSRQLNRRPYYIACIIQFYNFIYFFSRTERFLNELDGRSPPAPITQSNRFHIEDPEATLRQGAYQTARGPQQSAHCIGCTAAICFLFRGCISVASSFAGEPTEIPIQSLYRTTIRATSRSTRESGNYGWTLWGTVEWSAYT